MNRPTPDENPFYCLIEDDKLITGFEVKTERLLKPVPFKKSARKFAAAAANLARWPTMLLALIYGLVRLFLDALLACRRPDRSLRLEVVVLRQQLRVLERQRGRPRWETPDRLLLAALSQRLPRLDWGAFLVTPETLLRWHLELVRRKWALFARRRKRFGRPPMPDELKELVLRLARENSRYVKSGIM